MCLRCKWCNPEVARGSQNPASRPHHHAAALLCPLLSLLLVLVITVLRLFHFFVLLIVNNVVFVNHVFNLEVEEWNILYLIKKLLSLVLLFSCWLSINFAVSGP